MHNQSETNWDILADTDRTDQAYATGKRSVLIMDDEPAIREVISSMLEIDGYRVQVSENGENAVDTYRQALESGCPFDTVIIDLCVPNSMGGEETISALAVLDPQVKIIITTGDATNPSLERFAGRGYRDVLPKPFAFSDLSRLVRLSIEGCA